jgi:hypothetical protein
MDTHAHAHTHTRLGNPEKLQHPIKKCKCEWACMNVQVVTWCVCVCGWVRPSDSRCGCWRKGGKYMDTVVHHHKKWSFYFCLCVKQERECVCIHIYFSVLSWGWIHDIPWPVVCRGSYLHAEFVKRNHVRSMLLFSRSYRIRQRINVPTFLAHTGPLVIATSPSLWLNRRY